MVVKYGCGTYPSSWLIQGDSGGICNTLGNDSVCDSKQKVHMNMGPILNGYRDMVKRRWRTILRARTAIT